MAQLHRLTYYEYNTEGRRVKQHTPWHPNEEHLKWLAATYYSGIDVKFETVKCKDGSSSQDDYPNGSDPFGDMMRSVVSHGADELSDYRAAFA